jgi:2,3-diketo-5-methylthio-1-phosphopentane phosphatase
LGANFRIFCDFDGTITEEDVWVSAGKYFIKRKDEWAEVIRQWENFDIGTRECFIKECGLMEDFDKNIFNRIIDEQKFDPYFRDFFYFCQQKSIPFYILSEGMDYYIARCLKNLNLDIKFYSNHLRLSDNSNNFSLEFPNSDAECLRCGCCKRNLLMNMSAEDDITIYIGDGYSDACVVQYADIIFAKKSLASYCWKNNITYFDYENFSDVKRKMEKLMLKKKINHRQTARLKRREVLLQG